MSYLRGPLTHDQIATLMHDRAREGAAGYRFATGGRPVRVVR